MLGWHFLPNDGVLAHGDQRPVVVGATLSVQGPLKLCENGLHAARRAIDALRYAPGFVACRVRLSGKILTDTDKACAQKRTVLAMADARAVVLSWGCWATTGALLGARRVDQRSINAVLTVERYILGTATQQEVRRARAAAYAADDAAAAYPAPTAADAAADDDAAAAAAYAAATAADAYAADDAAAYAAAYAAATAADAAAAYAPATAADAARRTATNLLNAELERRLHALLGTKVP